MREICSYLQLTTFPWVKADKSVLVAGDGATRTDCEIAVETMALSSSFIAEDHGRRAASGFGKRYSPGQGTADKFISPTFFPELAGSARIVRGLNGLYVLQYQLFKNWKKCLDAEAREDLKRLQASPGPLRPLIRILSAREEA